MSDDTILAADPKASVWVAASAGTGKTTVLTNRTLSLLLAGTPPERILCITFTKAAAAEMANRIARRLGEWATVDDGTLSGQLTALTGETAAGDRLERARRLFARVVDAPGGLKIQTIHAFCESVLRRFPLEAGLAPHFQVMDERSADELMETARNEVLVQAQSEGNAKLAAALAEVTGHVAEDAFHELMTELARERGRLARVLAEAGGPKHAADKIYRRLGVKPDEDVPTIRARACADDAFDGAALRAAAQALLGGSKADRARGQVIADWLAIPATRAERWDDYLDVYITTKDKRKGQGKIRDTLATKDAIKAAPGIDAVLQTEAARLIAVRERIKAAITAQATAALLTLGAAVLGAYRRHKSHRALLDFDDLILETRRLLVRRGAAWVLYKLDWGLDHILIDEAQDTNPDQWDVVRALAEEFFTGEGARPETRTVFAVGDPKQSIFSFQRADPAAFETMRAHFAARAKQAAGTWRDIPLDKSYRSVPAVLTAVDAVFAQTPAADGVVQPGGVIHHEPHRKGQAGLVELWPAVVPRAAAENEPWTPPVRGEAEDSPTARLAALIAARIRGWIDGEERLPSRDRPIRAGDVMILVRRRNRFVEEMVRALKSRNVEVAGIDRMVLTDQLAVMDLIALARFLLMPDDDLTLATVLKSPLIGLDEEQLFILAHEREPHSLWHRLGAGTDQDPAFAAAHRYLAALLARVDFAPPYELFAAILGRPLRAEAKSGREKLLARLGPEAAEPLDEFLAQALAYERGHAPSLEGFLHWMGVGEGEIKRDPEAGARNEVRIMTVHGAKGLQAPIVILPDTLQTPGQGPPLLWGPDEKDGFLWPPRRASQEAVAGALREEADGKRDREYRRLLYVAMTRAEDRLYVCGYGNRKSASAGNWHDLVRAGLADLAAQGKVAPFEFDCTADIDEGWGGEGMRLVSPQTAVPKPDAVMGAVLPSMEPLPDWVRAAAPLEPEPARPLAPSRPSESEPPVRSPLGPDDGSRFRRGLLIHRLLEALPGLDGNAREAACRRYLARPGHGLSAEAQSAIAAETLAVLADPAFAALFGPGSRAEVPLTGVVAGKGGDVAIAGQLDRLWTDGREVLVVDYKTNRPPPETAEGVAPLYLKQMAAYRALLRQVYPALPVRCALLWTEGPRLMALPDPLLDRHAP